MEKEIMAVSNHQETIKANLNSIVFQTQSLTSIRKFYKEVLSLPIYKYQKNETLIEDESDKYVNFVSHNIIIGFEVGSQITNGKMVFDVADLDVTIRHLEKNNVSIIRKSTHYIIINDPEQREIILQQENTFI